MSIEINWKLIERVFFASCLPSPLSCSHRYHRQWQKKCTDRNQNLVTWTYVLRLSSRILTASPCELGFLDSDSSHYQIAEILQLLVFGMDAQEVTGLPSCPAAILFYCMEPCGKSRKALLLCCVLGCRTWKSHFHFMVLASKLITLVVGF